MIILGEIREYFAEQNGADFTRADYSRHPLLMDACCVYKKDNLFHEIFLACRQKVENLLLSYIYQMRNHLEKGAFSNEQFYRNQRVE